MRLLGLGRREAPWLSRGPAGLTQGFLQGRRELEHKRSVPQAADAGWATPGQGAALRSESLSELGPAGGARGLGQAGGVEKPAWRGGCRGARGAWPLQVRPVPRDPAQRQGCSSECGAGAGPVPYPGVSTSGPEGLGHPCAHIRPHVPELTSRVAHSLGQGWAPGRLPRLHGKCCRWQESETGPSHRPARLEAQTLAQKALQWPLVTRSPARPAPQTAARGSLPPRAPRRASPLTTCWLSDPSNRQRRVQLHGERPWSPGKRWPQAVAPGSPEPVTSWEAILLCGVWAGPVWQGWAQAAALLGRSCFPGHGLLTAICVQPLTGAACHPPASAPGCDFLIRDGDDRCPRQETFSSPGQSTYACDLQVGRCWLHPLYRWEH